MAVYLGAGDHVACSISSPESIVMLGNLEPGKISIGITLPKRMKSSVDRFMVRWVMNPVKASRKNNFPWLGAETPVWQGARTAHTPRMERTSNAARRDGSTPNPGKVYLREP